MESRVGSWPGSVCRLPTGQSGLTRQYKPAMGPGAVSSTKQSAPSSDVVESAT
jgi:hypothetical protein